ncbi:hypothetical protein Dda_6855 [Drechslerella dactyloides]|uniref:Myb-like domain-containing protein n=1 Tax=Drechslerella dactyloides TaxID=74499 RepID=A0AAD6IUR7_DREDA|nr:hypothetical protein Dda_6855 [Drechslerella dactyloides]
MTDVMESSEETAPLPTPPLSDDGKCADGETEEQLQGHEDHDDVDAQQKDHDDGVDEAAAKEIDAKVEETPSTAEQEKPKKKRGRPKSSDKPTASKPKKQKADPKDKTSTATPDGATPAKKPRAKSGGTDSRFTPQQDAYLYTLFTGSGDSKRMNNKQIHAAFEGRYQTGKSENAIRFRWYRLKEELESTVLSSEEETALKDAIESIETNKTQAVLNIYTQKGGESFTKLSQAFVWKKIAEWSAGGRSGDAKQGGVAGGAGEPENGNEA